MPRADFIVVVMIIAATSRSITYSYHMSDNLWIGIIGARRALFAISRS